VKLQTPSDPEQFKPARAVSTPEAAPISKQITTHAGNPAASTLDAMAPIKPSKKKFLRKAKPAALEPTAKINLNCTLERRDLINAAAASLGLTTTAYLLYCEEQSVHKLAQHLTNYIETVSKMNMEVIDSRLKKIEEFLKTMSSSY
jgi:uncharacterized protein (DUF1778 family)